MRRLTEDAGEEAAPAHATKETFGPVEACKWQHNARGQSLRLRESGHVSVLQQGPGRCEGRMAAAALVNNLKSKRYEKTAAGLR